MAMAAAASVRSSRLLRPASASAARAGAGRGRAAGHARGAARLAAPWSWRGEDLGAMDWTHQLTPEDVAEIRGAVAHARGTKLAEITSENAHETFPLPEVRKRMRVVKEALVEGVGVALVRGLPVESMSDADAALAYWGLCAHLGDVVAVPQNAKGHLLGHVCDIGGDASDPATRIYTTAKAQPWHTDSADIVGLLCLQTAEKGGDSGVVSSAAVYEELARRRPELAEALCDEVVWDRKGEVPDGEAPFFGVPVFTPSDDGRVVSMHDRSFVDAAQRRFTAEDGVPRLTRLQEEALDLVDALADELQLTMRLAPGDIQLLHSHTTWHMRTAYADAPRPLRAGGRRRRHLLRLWLSAVGPTAWSLPSSFARRYGCVSPGVVRGGIRAGFQTAPYAPLTPEG